MDNREHAKAWLGGIYTSFMERLYSTLVARESAAFSRLAITLLNIWQVYVIYSRGQWILPPARPFLPHPWYFIFVVVLATLSVVSLVASMRMITLIVLATTFVQFMHVGISSLIRTPISAGAGLFFFVALIAVTTFWRTLIIALKYPKV